MEGESRQECRPPGSATLDRPGRPVTPGRHAAHMRSNSSSSMIFTPNFCALSSLEPASAPATT
jgi:hypothetical protein